MQSFTYCPHALADNIEHIWIRDKTLEFSSTMLSIIYAHTHTHPFNGPFFGTTQVSGYQNGKTNLDFTEARDSKWQWHQLGRMQVCTLFQTYNHTSIPPLSFLQAGCPSCHPNNSIKALKGYYLSFMHKHKIKEKNLQQKYLT